MGNREIAKRRKSKKASSSNLTIILIIAAFAVVAVGMIILTTNLGNKQAAVPTSIPREVVIPTTKLADARDGLNMGDPNAKVKVTEFADFQCPACVSYWTQLEPTIIELYVNTGKVYFTYNPFSFLGQGQAWDESSKSAEAAYCANEQFKFWEYRDIIHANHNGENLGTYTRDTLITYSGKLGLDVEAFTSCLDSEKYTQQVIDDSQFASSVGATFTPSFLINGVVVNANDLMKTIEEALAK